MSSKGTEMREQAEKRIASQNKGNMTTEKEPKQPKVKVEKKSEKPHAMIRVLVENSPHKPGTQGQKNWEFYENGMTVEEYKKKSGGKFNHHFAWNKAQKHIEVVNG